MTYQRDTVAGSGADVLFRVIREPVKLFLEYRLIALETPNSEYPDFIRGNESNPEAETKYCILIICTDRFGGTETKFLYDVTRYPNIARDLLHILCNGSVTPSTAKYILEDLF